MNFKEDVPSLREGSLYKTIDAGIFSEKDEKYPASVSGPPDHARLTV
ncbi:hypothetical protein ATPR_2832 [Acetobacter tropicalis NBRC 101654]|uniref:Uncharacterized protein n=1 Tax=Acetobacter tropicalis NBRC 101654 TaxID=749388 RepID=F7VHI3_9PROT|nr:hypothetical protein ATPR_2832 [Acetobacter tropicalis NBRC 101654]